MNVINLDKDFDPFFIEGLKFSKFKFGGGEIQIKLDPLNERSGEDDVCWITHRVRNSDDLMEILLVKEALSAQLLIKTFNLHIPYLPYSRQDRRCELGEAFSLKVFTNILNNAGLDRVITIDSHSDVGPALLNNCTNVPNTQWVIRALFDIGKEVVLVSPDAGANKKINQLTIDLIKKGHDIKTIVKCDKIRDTETGRLSGFEVFSDDLKGQDCLIVDDICDGGGTFIGTAKELKKKNAGDIYLFVTHGIFSKGLDTLNEYFTKIYCTNSFSTLPNTDKFKQFDI